MENVQGTNVVTTILGHPSSYDAMMYHAQRTDKPLLARPFLDVFLAGNKTDDKKHFCVQPASTDPLSP
ncbi:hypothetical protein [Paraburkholderia aromaticivorans]|uniref:hypothetical protein n=1 Tax=Paraburkholderia aromaticivorans TaxID=2026199 RepID=UPI0038BAC752